ncbi:MAG TPA: hypothetical protein VMT53_07170 [Terriglobales bacterium]|nr:hypothetical protein [Terriglobales bacterium]
MPVTLCRRLGFLLFLAFATASLRAAWSQETPLPEAPSHKFLDRQNVTAFAALGGLIAIDGVHTQLMLDTHRFVEGDPIARPFVSHGWPGQLAGSALAYGSALGVSYMLHKANHHKIERWASWFFVAAEAANDTRNLLLKAPPPTH